MAILVAIDENERSRIVANIGFDLAEAYDDDLVALHVMPEEDFDAHRRAIQNIPEFRDYSIEHAKDSAAKFAKEFVVESVKDIGPQRIDARGRIGDVPEEILSEADSLEPRFLVISGRRRSPAGKAIFGNTAQQILLNAECPVVTKMSER